MKNNIKTILILVLIVVIFLLTSLFSIKHVDNNNDLHISRVINTEINTPNIRPKKIYPGGPFSNNKEKDVFPKDPNLIIKQNAKLWGPPLAPPFPNPPWPPSL